MNLGEFIVVFFLVFGITGFWLWWTAFVYGLEDEPPKKDPRTVTSGELQPASVNISHRHDITDYDGMGNQGRFPVGKSV